MLIMRRGWLSPYFVFSSLIISNLTTSVTCKLKCNNCSPKLQRALKTVVSSLTKVPDQQVCVWYLGGSGRGEVERLVKDLVSSYKVVASFDSDQVDKMPPFCRHNVLVTSGARVLGCQGLLAPSLPLTTDHHFYVLVPGHLDSNDLGLCTEHFGISRATFVFLRDAHVKTLSSPLFLRRRFLTSNITSLFKLENMIRVNLKGRTVNVASFNCPPFVNIHDRDNIDNITGIEWEVLKFMARIMNFTIKLAELKGSARWGHLENGSWTGGITRAVHDGNAELAVCNMWYTLEKFSIMDFGPPINVVKFTFIAPRPKPLLHHWKALVQVFDENVWVLVLILYFFSTISYWKFVAVNSRKRIRPGLAKCSLTMFGILMGAHWPPHGGRSGARLLVTWWCVFVLLLTSTYNMSIASRLTLQHYEQCIDTIEQLVQQDYRWSDDPAFNRDKRSTYFNYANDWQREWEERYVSVSASHMKEALDSGKFAFPIQRWGDRLLFFTVEGLDVHRDLKSMRVLKETTARTYESIKFAKRTPLFQAGQIALLRGIESGLVTFWTTQVSRAPENLFARRLLHEEEGRTELKRLSMNNLGPVFLMLGVGLSISLLIFTCECLCKSGSKA